MTKVLYLTNKEVPYRVAFFNLLSHDADLEVVYDSRDSGDRNKEWAKSIPATDGLKVSYLPGNKLVRLGTLYRRLKSFADGIIIVGCVNTFTGISAIAICRMLNLRYLINLDGEIFFGKGIKAALKKAVLTGASGYLTAGKSVGRSIECIAETAPIFPYSFSSVSAAEVTRNIGLRNEAGLPDLKAPVLVVGQYAEYKGLDIALAAARADRSIPYIFIGTGGKTGQFISDFGISTEGDDNNISVIPFLQKKELTDMYLRCSMLLLPSRQECWGLVVNEAASLGTPIVSTRGSGSAVEFLADDYPSLLAEPGNPRSLLEAIRRVRNMTRDELRQYSGFLMKRASEFTIDKSVTEHLSSFNILTNTKST